MRVKSIKYLWVAILWAIIVLILSSISGKNFDKLPKIKIPHLDKMVHFTMYFVLAILLFKSIKQISEQNLFNKYPYIFTLIICVLYGGIIEIMQEYIFTGRSMDLYDFIANSIGVALGLIFCFIFKRQNQNIII